MDSVFTLDRLRIRFYETAALTDRRAAGNVLAARLIHEVLGRLLPLVLLEGRAWDTGLENLWVHFDRDNDIDWVAVVDPTVRALPDDPWTNEKDERCYTDTVVVLPSESALTTWAAHRCHRTLAPLFVWLHSVCEGAISISSMWQLLGSTVVVAAAQLPRRTEQDEAISFRRSQAILDAMVGFGLPVRGPAMSAVQPKAALRRVPTSTVSSSGGPQL
nr:iron reductase [Mycolicibacter sp. MU0102]